MSVYVYRWGMRWLLDENTGAGWVTGSLAWMFRAGGFHRQHCFTAGSHPPPSLPPSPNSALLSTLPFLFSNCCIGDLSSHAEMKVWCHLTAFHKQNEPLHCISYLLMYNTFTTNGFIFFRFHIFSIYSISESKPQFSSGNDAAQIQSTMAHTVYSQCLAMTAGVIA